MKLMRRAPLWGAIGLILIIILLINTNIYITHLKQENLMLEQKLEVLKKENEELKEKISELEERFKNNITPNDRETLARLVFLEGNGESLECQKGIASVVINRVNSGHWGNTIDSVVYAQNQFTPASKIPYVTPTATNYEAVDYVLKNGVTLPYYVLYFRAQYHFSWRGYVPYVAIGNTYFGYMAKDKQ